MDLSAAARDRLPSSAFLLPNERKLPVHDKGHWRAAAGRIDQTEGLSDDEKTRLKKKWRHIGVLHGWLKPGE